MSDPPTVACDAAGLPAFDEARRICRRTDRSLEGEEPADLSVQAPAPERRMFGRFGYCVRNI